MEVKDVLMNKKRGHKNAIFLILINLIGTVYFRNLIIMSSKVKTEIIISFPSF